MPHARKSCNLCHRGQTAARSGARASHFDALKTGKLTRLTEFPAFARQGSRSWRLPQRAYRRLQRAVGAGERREPD